MRVSRLQELPQQRRGSGDKDDDASTCQCQVRHVRGPVRQLRLNDPVEMQEFEIDRRSTVPSPAEADET